MFKKLSLTALLALLAGCSSLSSYIPFTGNAKPVINLPQDQIDQKSYALAYSTTVQARQGMVAKDYDVNSFASGVNDWYLGRILVSLDQIKAKLASGIDSQIHAYYSGVVFAADLQQNVSRLKAGTCWEKLDRPSLTQGIYDAMLDLQKNQPRGDDDAYISQGTDQLMKICQ